MNFLWATCETIYFILKEKYKLDKMSNIDTSKVHPKVLNFLDDWKSFLKKMT